MKIMRILGSQRPKPLKLRLFIFILAAAVLLVILISYGTLSSVIVDLAVSEAYDNITYTVNEVLAEEVIAETIDYNDMVSLLTDNNGNITALVTNMANVNYLQAKITNAIVKKFAESDVTKVEIPLGSLFGNAFLSGHGPRISANILSVTNVNTTFRNEFSDAGINQTRHRIMMDVDVTLGILLAGYQNRWDTVTTEITVAETVIVGSVPNTYANLDK
ncbi:MAG: sporulation protein YunB [Oscillospiraceae bacterium]|nr:sporulation protein YunB [Oscillospiraceae bacterium]